MEKRETMDQANRAWSELRHRLQEIYDLKSAASLLGWDQVTYMPPGGARARGRQLATLGRLAHEKLTDPALGRLLDSLEATARPGSADDAALLRVVRRDYDRATRIPPAFIAEFAQHQVASYETWAMARPANDFAAVVPLLERTLDFSRQYADYFPGYDHIADPLIDALDEGMTVAIIQPLFAQLRGHLTPLIRQISGQPPVEDSFLYQSYPEADQLAFGAAIARAFGYDFARGRQDLTLHPFATSFSPHDVRITTRVYGNDLGQALFSTLHESGHAMYEQGVDPAYEGTPLAQGTSAGVHESQSRLWENLVGRSWPFWNHYFPQLQALFPQQLGQVSTEQFYRAVNKVQPSLIRTDADEVTYNLHVIIRFELELALLEGKLAVRDLAEAWRAAYAATLGLTPPDDRDGVLQDAHWYAGYIGGEFQGYTLGNILSAQFYGAAVRAHPEIPAEIGGGKFDTLYTWLRENIYHHGRKLTTAELVERTTGGPLRLEPYLGYLWTKYGEIYELKR
jgi:carboxypeptidase Taq